MRACHSILLVAVVLTLSLANSAPARPLVAFKGTTISRASTPLVKVARGPKVSAIGSARMLATSSSMFLLPKTTRRLPASKSITRAKLMHQLKFKPGDAVSLNPQPLPPKVIGLLER